MKRSWFSRVIANAIIVASFIVGSLLTRYEVVYRANAQPSEHSGPVQMRSEFDNESMTVLRIRMAPHEKTGMHDVSPRLVIWLTDAHLRDVKPDGTTTNYRRTAGSTEWVPAQMHAGENLSENPIEFLAVVPKPGHSVPSATDAHK